MPKRKPKLSLVVKPETIAAAVQPERIGQTEAPLYAAAWAVVRHQRMMHIWRTAGRECDCKTCLAVRALRDELVRLGIKDTEEKA